ncbi:MAG: HD domain-containing protein, partial [Armatimonadetes bacterium]|nr:HD domain-containing protein [Armatimonadota bacterium]
MAKQFVKDLRPGDRVDGCFVVRQCRLVPFRNKPGNFLDLILADRSGEVIARMWDNAEQAAEVAGVGAVVRVRGRCEEYQGRLQVILDAISVCAEGEYDSADFLRSGKADRQEMVNQLRAAVASLRHPHLRALVDSFFGDDELLAKFAEAPASKQLHHAHLGGLMEHTLGVIRILEGAVEVHPELDRDLLIAGALLHDIGKVEELEVRGSTIEYTDIGRLVGHIVLTDRMVTEKIATLMGFIEELQARLTHLLLSHHGQKEYGAPVLPMTPEACALHYADNLDAHVQYFSEV